MRAADHRQFRLRNKKRGFPRWLKISLVALGAVILIFVLSNLVMGVIYRNKVLPNYSVAAVPIGNVKFSELGGTVPVEKLLPAQVEFKKEDKTEEISPKDLGVAVDWAVTQENIRKSRSWLPIMSLVFKKSVPAELKLDNSKFALAAKDLEKAFTKAPLPERVKFQDNNFVIAAPEAGYQLDVVQLRLELMSLLEKGKASLEVPVTTSSTTEPTGKLQEELGKLQKYLEAKITLVSGAQTRELGRADIAGFFEPSGQTLKLSDAKITQVVASVASVFGIAAVNQGEAVSAINYALQKQQQTQFVLAAQGAKIYHYCVGARGVDASVLGEYRLKLAAVYGDPRGWNNQGEVAMVYAESGCDYTAWLSAAAEMTSFGGVCDNYYSCRSGNNVVVNYDRWMGATDPWNAAGGSSEDYRVMVINHETGHWLGFGHRNCTGAGQPAPVMQQQSIDLQGCKFNPWPTAAELAVL